MPTIKIIGSIETAETVLYSNSGSVIINAGGNIGRFASGTLYRAYVWFEIPNIIGKVLDAKLGLTSTGGQSSSTTFILHRVTEPWVAEEVNISNQPSFAPEFVSKILYADESGFFDGITSMVDGMANGSIPNYGFHIKSRYENAGDSIFFAGINAIDVNTRPYLEITYNESPARPTLIEPNGGESYDQTQTIAWVDSTDPESNPLTYQIQLSIDNGSTWKTLASNDTASPFVYNFINETETSQALIRVRSHDGLSYSEWSTSEGVFTIQHNVAPFIPTNLSPNAVPVDRLKTSRFSWKHNDSPNDNQTKAEINWRHQGDTSWSVILSDGPEQEYYFSPSTFIAGPTEWRVKTYDKFGVVSPWSNIAVFTAAEPTNVPTIIQPTSVANVSRPLVEWTSTTQSSYQVVVEDSLGVVIWDTGELVSMVRTRTIGVDLFNGGTYKVKVRVKDGSGLFSSFAEKTFTVSYTPPAKPIVQAYKATGAISLSIEHPTPIGTQPLVLNSDVYKLIDGTWTRIAIGINGTYTDHMVKSDESYEYRVVTFGDNDTSVTSDVKTQSIKLSGTWLHVENNPETLHQFRYAELGRSDNRSHDYSKRRYAGRNKPVVVFSEYEERDIQLTFTLLKRDTDWEALQAIYDARQPIVYRDGRGRMLVGILGKLPSTDTWYGNSVSVTFEEVDYREGV